LLIPVYKESEKMLVDENYTIKFEINNDDYELTKNYYNYIGDKIALIKFDCQPKIINKIKESFNSKEQYYKTDSNIATIEKPEILIKSIINHFSLRSKEFKEFKNLENEIIHFKQIKISKDKVNNIKETIEKIKIYPQKESKEKELKEKFNNNQISIDDYTKEIRNLDEEYKKEIISNSIKIKYIKNHYYIPIALSENEKETYLQHIIKTKSEVGFINELENYIQQENNFFEQFDWWFFSKIDETIDEVYIPYYQPKNNKIEKFKPDFIFWLKKNNQYIILLIDPKGSEHSDAYRKIDGFKRIFEKGNDLRPFDYDGYIVKVVLKYFNPKPLELVEYKSFWIASVKE
ncbi:MAG: hypothetical protein N2314_09350, partial [Brevinematales bacterium]|nr:hypothetical protein [Brevinematales bacterium]